MKKPISARIDEDTLIYIKSCHEPLNTLINVLLKKWIKNRQDKELLIWKEDTGQDEFSQMKANENIKCSQSCSNCTHYKASTNWCNELKWCMKQKHIKTFCCIYWDKKKGSR